MQLIGVSPIHRRDLETESSMFYGHKTILFYLGYGSIINIIRVNDRVIEYSDIK